MEKLGDMKFLSAQLLLIVKWQILHLKTWNVE